MKQQQDQLHEQHLHEQLTPVAPMDSQDAGEYGTDGDKESILYMLSEFRGQKMVPLSQLAECGEEGKTRTLKDCAAVLSTIPHRWALNNDDMVSDSDDDLKDDDEYDDDENNISGSEPPENLRAIVSETRILNRGDYSLKEFVALKKIYELCDGDLTKMTRKQHFTFLPQRSIASLMEASQSRTFKNILKTVHPMHDSDSDSQQSEEERELFEELNFNGKQKLKPRTSDVQMATQALDALLSKEYVNWEQISRMQELDKLLESFQQ